MADHSFSPLGGIHTAKCETTHILLARIRPATYIEKVTNTFEMDPHFRRLWETIRDFEMDGDAAPGTFEAQLKEKTGWSRNYSVGAIEEYKRFVLLAVLTDRGVSPSKPIDRVWHLHMTFTVSYWEGLCRDILGQALHHTPGSKDDAPRFREQYARALSIYKEVFGAAPDTNYWPRLEHRTSWVPKPRLSRNSRFIKAYFKHIGTWLTIFGVGLTLML